MATRPIDASGVLFYRGDCVGQSDFQLTGRVLYSPPPLEPARPFAFALQCAERGKLVLFAKAALRVSRLIYEDSPRRTTTPDAPLFSSPLLRLPV